MKITKIITSTENLSGYDKVVAECSITNYGYAFITEYGDILDWELTLDDVQNILEKGEI